MFFLKNPSQLSEENGNTSDFPAHSELQIVIGFSKTYGIVMGFLKNQSLFWGQSSFQIVMGFLAKTTQPNGFGHQKCDWFFKDTSQFDQPNPFGRENPSQFDQPNPFGQENPSKFSQPNLFGQESLEHLVYLGSNRFAMSKTRSRT